MPNAAPALLAEAADHVLTVTINRPHKKNAVDAEVLCGLSDAWHRLDEDDDLRVAILTGAGGNFCAGMDLSVIAKLSSGAPPEWSARGSARWNSRAGACAARGGPS